MRSRSQAHERRQTAVRSSTQYDLSVSSRQSHDHQLEGRGTFYACTCNRHLPYAHTSLVPFLVLRQT